MGAALKSLLDPHSEKKKAKTAGRAKAYEDFVVYCFSGESNGVEYRSIVARIVLYGETPVLRKLKDFGESPPTKLQLESIIGEMRNSLVTKRKPETMEAIRKIVGDDV